MAMAMAMTMTTTMGMVMLEAAQVWRGRFAREPSTLTALCDLCVGCECAVSCLYFHTEEERQAWERKVEDNIERVRAHVYTQVHERM